MTPVRLGVLGCGWIAGNRLRQIADSGLVEVVLLADPDRAAIERIRRWTPRAQHGDGVDAFRRARVDAVMISTPSAMHGEQALALLEHGLPLFVQKPIGLSAAEVDRVLDAAARADVPLATDLCYRHLESSRALRAALQEQRIGSVFLVEGCFYNAYRPGAGWAYDPKLAGGGALVDLGIHLIDLTGWLCGEHLRLADAHLRGRYGAGDVERFALIDLVSTDGAPVRLAVSWDAATGHDAEIRLRLYGELGTLELANRGGSFYDFEARLCDGPRVRRLAVDDGDAWQAGPLAGWLGRVAAGLGYREPDGVREVAELIDEAYALARTKRADSTAARGTVRVVGKQGVMP
ncbi:MAG TPA: Gfo/Idh/MocA family oxidoreductase [Pseudomonadales bacterium]